MDGWFTKAILGRVHTENNALIIVEGGTGTGKSCLALNLCKKFDPYFSSKRIAFTGLEFFDLLPIVPHKGFLLWDENLIELSIKSYSWGGALTPKMAVGDRYEKYPPETFRLCRSSKKVKILLFLGFSFRYKLINVIFTVPSASYIDKSFEQIVLTV